MKLPLRVEASRFEQGLWFIVDADGNDVDMTPHRAEVIVAALTAAAKGTNPRGAALLEAADEMDRMWTDQVSQRPKVNFLRAGMDSAYRQAAERLRKMAKQCTCLSDRCEICANADEAPTP